MFADPISNLKQFGLKDGMSVADLGAGSGAYTFPAAEIVRNGKVYALEVQKDLLVRITNEAKQRHLSNIHAVWANIEKIGGTKLAERAVDAVIISNVLFQVEDRETFIKEIKRILKTGGRVLLIDWSDTFGGMGPQAEVIIPKETTRTLFENQGFKFESEINAGAHHYGIIFNKS